MKATRFMRKPFIVTGYQVTEENMDALAEWCEGHVIQGTERTFIRVPVNRPTSKKQTEAYVGTWILLSIRKGEKSFKVYTEEWIAKDFTEVPDEISESLSDEEDDDRIHITDNVRVITAHIPNKPVTFRAAT